MRSKMVMTDLLQLFRLDSSLFILFFHCWHGWVQPLISSFCTAQPTSNPREIHLNQLSFQWLLLCIIHTFSSDLASCLPPDDEPLSQGKNIISLNKNAYCTDIFLSSFIFSTVRGQKFGFYLFGNKSFWNYLDCSSYVIETYKNHLNKKWTAKVHGNSVCLTGGTLTWTKIQKLLWRHVKI